jgi:hypothetical protein
VRTTVVQRIGTAVRRNTAAAAAAAAAFSESTQEYAVLHDDTIDAA